LISRIWEILKGTISAIFAGKRRATPKQSTEEEKKMKDSQGIPRGLQALISRKCEIHKSTVSAIFAGKRRATPKQAAAMEEQFIKRGVPLTRWDLLYGVNIADGESLDAYIQRCANGNKNSSH
jgi:hypothetical protein